jgi:uncharacterized membrane protein
MGNKMKNWIIPTTYLAIGIVCGFAIPQLEHTYLAAYTAGMSVASAQAFFGAISSGMLALIGIVFAISFVMVQFGAAAYSPRIVVMFINKPSLAHSLGLFFATFVMALSALAWTDHDGSGAVPHISQQIILALVIISLVAFALLIRSLGDLQIQNVLASIGEKGRAVIKTMFPRLPSGRAPAEISGLAVPDGLVTQVLSYAGPPRAITRFVVPKLTALAQTADAVIVMDCAVGDTIVEDTVLLRVIGGRVRLSEKALLRAVHLGVGRTFEQDPKYAIRLLVDIGIRALSPAINDPTTAVQAIDQIEDLLHRLGHSDLNAGHGYDGQGTPRLIVPMALWSDYLTLAFDEIRQYGMASVQVLRRLRAALTSLATSVGTEPRREEVLSYLRRLDAGVGGNAFDDEDTANSLREDRQGLGLSRGPGRDGLSAAMTAPVTG